MLRSRHCRVRSCWEGRCRLSALCRRGPRRRYIGTGADARNLQQPGAAVAALAAARRQRRRAPASATRTSRCSATAATTCATTT